MCQTHKEVVLDGGGGGGGCPGVAKECELWHHKGLLSRAAAVKMHWLKSGSSEKKQKVKGGDVSLVGSSSTGGRRQRNVSKFLHFFFKVGPLKIWPKKKCANRIFMSLGGRIQSRIWTLIVICFLFFFSTIKKITSHQKECFCNRTPTSVSPHVLTRVTHTHTRMNTQTYGVKVCEFGPQTGWWTGFLTPPSLLTSFYLISAKL